MKGIYLTPLLLSFIGASAMVHADALVNTFSSIGPGFDPTSGYFVAAQQYMGKEFSVVGNYVFTEIDIPLAGSHTGSSLTVSLCDAFGAGPGSVIESFSVVPNHLTATNCVFTSTLHPMLTTGNYFVSILPTDPSSNGGWSITNDGSTSTQSISADQGATWNSFTNTAGVIAVFANPVPEPATMATVGVGLAALIRRKRRI